MLAGKWRRLFVVRFVSDVWGQNKNQKQKMLYNKEREHLGMSTDARALSAWHLLQTKQGKTSAQAECSLLAGMMPRFSSHMALPCSGKKPRFSQHLV